MAEENKILYDTKFLQLKVTKSPAGHDWVYAHRPNASNVVVIVPIIHAKDGDKIIFIETRRPPIYAENKAETCIEVPAGLVGDEINGETVIDAVKKELLEETGYSAEKIEIVVPLMSSSGGCTSETSAMAVADIYNDKIIKEPVTDGGIIIKRYKIALSEAENWLKQQQEAKKCMSAQALAALYFAKTH